MTKILKSILCVLVVICNTQAQDFLPRKQKTFTGYGGTITNVKVSAKSSYFALTSKNSYTELRNQAFEKIWSNQNDPANYGGKIDFSPNEQYLAFTKYLSRRDVGILDIAQRKVIQRINAGRNPAVQFSPDGKFLAIAVRGKSKESGVIKLLTKQGTQFKVVQSFNYEAKRFQFFRNLRFSSDSKFLVGVGITSNVFILKRTKNKFAKFQAIPRKPWLQSVAFHPNNQQIIFSTRQYLYTLTQKKRSGKFVLTDSIRTRGRYAMDLKFNDKGTRLMVSRDREAIQVYEWAKGKIARQEEDSFQAHGGKTISADFNKYHMISGGQDNAMTIYSLAPLPVALIKHSPKKVIKKRGSSTKNDNSSDDLDIDLGLTKGKNYLLVVGINKYKFWNPLSNATTDAKKVKSILQKRYGFISENTFEIYNEDATSKNILKKLSKLREKIGPQDNLLLYYSGHGYYNAAIEEGFWIPFNAQKGEETQYLANATLLKYIKAIKARHIFLVADACFSGSLFTQGNRGYIDNVEQYRSRWGFASGRLEFVSDGSVGKSSPFATYFLKYLTTNKKKRFAISELIQYVKVSVANNANQTPIGHPLKNVGDEGGEFVFYLQEK